MSVIWHKLLGRMSSWAVWGTRVMWMKARSVVFNIYWIFDLFCFLYLTCTHLLSSLPSYESCTYLSNWKSNVLLWYYKTFPFVTKENPLIRCLWMLELLGSSLVKDGWRRRFFISAYYQMQTLLTPFVWGWCFKLQATILLQMTLSCCNLMYFIKNINLLQCRLMLCSIMLLYYKWYCEKNLCFSMNDKRKSQICGGCKVRTWPLSASHSLEHSLPCTLIPVESFV